jgi:hypothetical protein
MLEEVSEARAAFDFIARAYVVIDGDGYNRRRVVFGKDDAQSVV